MPLYTPSGGGAVSSVVGQTGAVTGTQIVADTTVDASLDNVTYQAGVR